MENNTDYIDNLANNLLNNMQVTPNANWNSFESKFLNRQTMTQNVSSSTKYKNIFNKFTNVLTTKVVVVSTIVLITIAYFTVNNQNNAEVTNIKKIKKENLLINLSENRRDNIKKNQTIFIDENLKDKNIIKTKNKTKKIEQKITNVNVVDTVQVAVQKKIIVKKLIYKKDTVKVTDTIKK